MSLVSKIAAIEQALLALLQADTTLGAANPPVPVSMGDPAAGTQPEHVWLADDITGEWDPDVTMGPTPTEDEIVELRVIVYVSKEGNDAPAVRDRAMALAGAVTAVVGANRRISNSCDDAYTIKVEREGGATESKRIMWLAITVRCRSSLA